MDYRKGDRVKHPSMHDWGLGEVLEDSNGETVRIFFVGAGEKTLSLKYLQPAKVAGDEAVHAGLDNLKLTKGSSGVAYKSLPQSKEFFMKEFPEGFHGERFASHERNYKEKAHKLALDLLDMDLIAECLTSGNYTEIAKRSLRLVNSTNIIFPNEKMSLKDGLKSIDAQRKFGETLFGLLYGTDELESRFSAFSAALEEIGAAKWTIATYFTFFVHPNRHMFVKPTISQYAADVCRFEINYRSQLNWLTYKSVLAFSEYLRAQISELRPRDMIDVQSFMWCIAPDKYRSE